MTQVSWGWLVVLYLFLGGLGAGAFLTAAVMELTRWRYRREVCPTALTGAVISGPAVALGSVLLIFDLGAGKMEPWRIFYLFTHFSSVMTWGIWLLCLFIPVALFYGLLELIEVVPFLKGVVMSRVPRLVRDIRRYRRWVAIVGSVLAVGVAIYTGVLISAVGPAMPFWSLPFLPFLPIPIMPLLFVVSAISTGQALAFDLAATIVDPGIQRQMRGMDLAHIVLIAAENILIGLVYPFVVHAYAIGAGQHSVWSGIGSGAGILIAGLFLRYLIIAAGIPVHL
jgi:formate-dependent nitrite reductase membrane component NrfD